jgi:hypothetical protein
MRCVKQRSDGRQARGGRLGKLLASPNNSSAICDPTVMLSRSGMSFKSFDFSAAAT